MTGCYTSIYGKEVLIEMVHTHFSDHVAVSLVMAMIVKSSKPILAMYRTVFGLELIALRAFCKDSRLLPDIQIHATIESEAEIVCETSVCALKGRS